MMCSNLKKLWACTSLCFLLILPSRAQVRPLPVIPPDSLAQTYTGRLAHTLLNAYVRQDSLRATLSGYVTISDTRLSDSRTPKGSAGGDLTGSYPNPTIKSSVNLTGNPTVSGNLTTGGTLTVNGTGESRIQGNLRLKGSGNYGNKINLGDGDYVYLHEVSDDNLTVKAKNIVLSPTASVTAPTPATSDNSTKVATTAFVKAVTTSKLAANFGYMTNSSSQEVYIEPFHRGGRKMNDEKAFICRLVSKDLEWCSAALVGDTYASVQIVAKTGYAGNYIYQMADGRYINIINKEGQVGPHEYVLFVRGAEEILVRSAIWLPCGINEFISNISQFSF